ncbi:MAG: hypothetical protein FWC43_03595 [Planctomycetaceae bacterium]|nr:hypothetical protein [Planctomycetaceae bacterium]
MSEASNRYLQLIETIFFKYYKRGKKEVHFVREDLETTAEELGIKLPKNLGDVVYSFRYRSQLPDSITRTAPQGSEWVIRPMGQAKYMFSLSTMPRIVPNMMLSETKIPDSTPGVVERYALNDEQGLLTKLRYNRLVDIFLGISCYSLQNHLRTTVPDVGQIETDEIYIGLDKRGAHYVIPIQAKGGKDQLGTVQIEQDFALCRYKFPGLVCIPVAAQFMENDLIALFSFEYSGKEIAILCEKHYRLVAPDKLPDEEISKYGKRTD